MTADGLLEPLGFSQVVRVVEGLARRGWPYEIFSLEKAPDLERTDRVGALRSRLNAAGINWKFATYAGDGTAASAARNEAALVSAAARTPHVVGIHARAYHSAVAAFARWLSDRTRKWRS